MRDRQSTALLPALSVAHSLALAANLAACSEDAAGPAQALQADTLVDVYLSTATESFTLAGSLEGATTSTAAAFDSVNTLYLLVVNNSTSAQTVTLQIAPGAVTITGLSPGSGVAGTAVTISGQGFGALTDARTVTFNGVPLSQVTCNNKISNNRNTSYYVDLVKPAGSFTVEWNGGFHADYCPQQKWNYVLTYEGRQVFASGCGCGDLNTVSYSGTKTYLTASITACSSPVTAAFTLQVGCP